VKTRLFQQALWTLVVASIGLISPTESLAAPARLLEIQERTCIARADDKQELPLICQQNNKTPVANRQADVSRSECDRLMQVERIGEFKIDSSACIVLKILGHPQKQSKQVFSEVDALYRQIWYYSKQGITFTLVAENEGDNPKVAAVKITSPSRLTTDRGIKIGDSYNKVVRIYGECQDQADSVPFERLTAGSVYGGLIFSFRNGRVVDIFLGAAAE
jgi:hypothetical protein